MAADGGRLRGAAARPGDEPSVRPKSAWLPKISRWSETTTSQIPSQSTSPAVPRQPEKESAAPTEREGPSHPSVGTTKPTDCAAKEPGGVGNSPKRGGQPEPKEPGGEKAQDPRNKGKPEPGDHLVGNPNAPAEPQARSSAPASKTAKSQTELLIEYFEGSKPVGTANARKPSVRVRVTPSSKAGKSRRNVDTIAIPRPHSTSKGPKRKPPRPVAVEDREEGMGADLPLPSDVSSIPACSFLDKPDRADGKAAPSNISAIPADSFLDGPGADRSSSSRMKTDRRSQGKAARRISKASKLDDEKPRRKSSRGHTEAVVSEAPLTEAQQKLLEDIRRIILPPMKKKQETEQQPASQKQANQRSGTNDPAQLAPDVDDSMSLPDDLTTETGSRRRRRAGGWQRKGQVFGALEPVLEENKSIPPPSLPTLSEVLAMPLGSTTCATISSRGCEPLNVPVAPSSKKKEDLNASKTSGPGKTPLPPLSDAAVRLLHLVDEQEAASDRSRAMLVGLCRSLQDQFDGKIQRLEQGVVGEASAEMKEMKV
ncbi:hypothetical protein QBC34DRAFT_418227 [Podospora aff. communis PSN243]|uniref:Uncharacterized protein n=1 Tax=Podospora aff. communis PSN243 TaxID=3040156 RepID=A0AAV9G612_9PEZI|nr:hypothetical protein QBC34DRAFT_418227 [Podospora aff. communis PSN243]